MRADWTASGACTSGSIAPPKDATRRGSGGAATTSTTNKARAPADARRQALADVDAMAIGIGERKDSNESAPGMPSGAIVLRRSPAAPAPEESPSSGSAALGSRRLTPLHPELRSRSGAGFDYRADDLFRAAAARMSVLKASSSISSPSWRSIARLALPSRLELNSPEGSLSEAPLEKVSFTTLLYVSPVQISPS